MEWSDGRVPEGLGEPPVWESHWYVRFYTETS
jgi:hypothetical protein